MGREERPAAAAAIEEAIGGESAWLAGVMMGDGTPTLSSAGHNKLCLLV